jgi:hypothetical protein
MLTVSVGGSAAELSRVDPEPPESVRKRKREGPKVERARAERTMDMKIRFADGSPALSLVFFR